jgi:hypothetical protein
MPVSENSSKMKNFHKHFFSDIIINRELGFSNPNSFTHHFYASQVFPILSKYFKENVYDKCYY